MPEQQMTSFYRAILIALLSFPTASYAQTLAFPEAEGFGRYTTGARTNLSAASVYHVTNLNDSGPGSFRDAVSQSNRFVVFDVGGIANIQSVVPVASNITIAGQTAPGGFTIYNDRISFTGSNNLISRHFAVRKGQPGVRSDAASIARGTNMIFDHMSITWGVDGTFDINPDSGYVIDNITIQNSIVAQGLDRLGHSTGGLMQPGSGGSVSVIKSLWADNVTRNPKVRDENEFINNVVYGWETAGYIMGDTSGTSNANVVGNYFIEGPVDGSSPFNSGTSSFHIYANDNWIDANRNGVLDGTLNTSYPGADVIGAPHAFPSTAALTAQQAVTHVMANAGPYIVRDAVDTRLMQEVASYGTLGGVIMRETDLFPGFGSDPVYLNPRARLSDDDNDGIADNWEASHGLSSADPSDWKGLNPAGYTRLEEYTNELGADGTMVTSSGGAWTTPATWSGGLPTLADEAVSTGDLTITGGHAFARRATVGGSVLVDGGTLDVFDTATIEDSLVIQGGAVTAGRMFLAGSGHTGTLTVETGAKLQTGTLASAGGTGSLVLNGGVFHATGAPDIRLPTILDSAGGTIDTGGFSGSISGSLSGGGFTKRGAGSLTLSGPISYTGPTVIEEGEVIVQGSGWGETSSVTLGSGSTLDLSSVPGGMNLTAGKSLGGGGTVVGNVVAGPGAIVHPEGSVEVVAHAIGIQAEELSLGSDWAVFNNALHGAGAGGSYNGADLNGGGIVLVTNDRGSGLAPIATGVAFTSISIPESKTWYLYVKAAEPEVSPLAGDPATQPRGNNSFFASGLSGTVQATTSNYEEVQTNATPSDLASWNLVSPSLAPLDGVSIPENAGIDYFLTAGTKPFAIYGRELGTILDGFVLADTNLTAAQLEAALSGTTLIGNEHVLTVEGDYWQQSGATLELEVAGGNTLNKLAITGSALLAGGLSISLADGFEPQAGDIFPILSAASLTGQFDNAAAGSRLPTADYRGSFLVNYNYTTDIVSLSSYLAAIPGDFNFDMVVNDDDLLWWQSHYGSPLSGTEFLLWQRNYGTGLGGLAAVPEPAATSLLTIAVVSIVFWRSAGR